MSRQRLEEILESIKEIKGQFYLGTLDAYLLYAKQAFPFFITGRIVEQINKDLKRRYKHPRYLATETNVLYLLSFLSVLHQILWGDVKLRIDLQWCEIGLSKFPFPVFSSDPVLVYDNDIHSPDWLAKYCAQKSPDSLAKYYARILFPCYYHLNLHENEYPENQKFLFLGLVDWSVQNVVYEIDEMDFEKLVGLRKSVQFFLRSINYTMYNCIAQIDPLHAFIHESETLRDAEFPNPKEVIYNYLKRCIEEKRKSGAIIEMPKGKVFRSLPFMQERFEDYTEAIATYVYLINRRFLPKDRDSRAMLVLKWALQAEAIEDEKTLRMINKAILPSKVADYIFYLVMFPIFELMPGFLLPYNEIEEKWGRSIYFVRETTPLDMRKKLLRKVVKRMYDERMYKKVELKRAVLSEFITVENLTHASYSEIINYVLQKIKECRTSADEMLQKIKECRTSDEEAEYYSFEYDHFLKMLQYYEGILNFLKSEKNWVKRMQGS